MTPAQAWILAMIPWLLAAVLEYGMNNYGAAFVHSSVVAACLFLAVVVS